ncbi:MAG: ABC-2 family transporter protein [bacterium]
MLKNIKQGLVIIRIAWVRNLNYRFTILSYRFGEIIELLVLILMWTAIYSSGSGVIKGFTLNEMITYVLVGNLVATAVRNFLPGYVARDINEGRLSMALTRPVPYIKLIFFNEIGRAALASILSVISQLIIILFFLEKFVFNTDVFYILLVLVMVFFAFIIEWLIGFLVGTISFWTDEIDGIQTTIDRVKRFFSGGYFPLSLLPASLSTLSIYLPFAYSFYFPTMLYLRKMDLEAGLIGVGIQIVWIIILSLILRIVWIKGLKKYEASGS